MEMTSLFHFVLFFLCKGALLLTQEGFLIPFVVLGIYFYDKAVFGRTLFIFLFSMVLSTYLKSIWQIPLPETAHIKGWAYPSGHMLTAVIFWGWLAWEVRKKWFSCVASALVVAIGVALIYLGYHRWVDILGAWCFGVIALILYNQLYQISFIKNHEKEMGLGLATIGLLFILLLPKSFPHVWIAEGGLIGFSFGWMLTSSQSAILIREKVKRILILFLGVITVYVLFSLFFLHPSMKNFFQFLIIGFWMGGGVERAFRWFSSSQKRE